MQPGRRRPSRPQSCFPDKKNPWGVGFGHRRPPAKTEGPGSQGQLRPSLPIGERRAGGENGLRCFPEPRRVGAVVACPRRLSLCTMQRPEARFGPSVPRGLGTERPNWLRGQGCGLGTEGLRAPNPASPPRRTRGEWVSGTGEPQQRHRAQGAGEALPRFALWRAEAAELAQGAWLRPGGRRPSRAQSCFPAKENPWGVGFGHRRPPARTHGPGSQGQPRPALPSGERRAGGENGLRCFHEPRRVGAVVGCPRRLSLCTMQPPEARFGPSVRRGLERPRWLRGHGWGVGPEGFRAPNPASPPRRTRGEGVSGTGEPQQRHRAQGARGSPAPLCPLESGGPGSKTACVAFLSRGALGLLLAARGDFPFAQGSCQKLV